MTNAGLLDHLAAERLAIADLLESLTPEQWRAPTLCGAWDVHGLAAHLVVPTDASLTELAARLARAGGRIDTMALAMASRRATADSAELVARLRAGARSTMAPPVLGLVAPYTDAVVHGEDLRVPLGLSDDRDPARWVPALDFLVSRRARVGFRTRPLPDLTYAATDTTWAHGTGPRVEGPAAAVALALSGRSARLEELGGPGADALRVHARRR